MDQDVAFPVSEPATASQGSDQGLSGLSGSGPAQGPAQGAAPALEGQVIVAPRQRPRGRFMGYRMPEEWRAKIQAGKLLARAHLIALGKVDKHPAQLAVERAMIKDLLDKVIPNLSSVDVISDSEQVIRITTRME